MRQSAIVITVALIVLTLVPAGVIAQRGMHHMQNMDQLELSAEQRDQLESYITEHRKQMIQLRADMKVAHMELEGLIEDGASESEVQDKVNQLNEVHGDLLNERAMHKLRVRNLLGADKYDMWQSRRGWNMHGMMHGECGKGKMPHVKEGHRMQRHRNRD